MSQSVAIIGCGLIGRAWAIAFAKGGWAVQLFDAAAGAADAALATIDELLADLEANQLLSGQSPAEVRGRMRAVGTLEEACAGVAWVQENAPEKLDVKRALWPQLDRAAPADAILASSTSALVPSMFTAHLDGRQRCLVCHPLNPPYLIPATELCPAPWTSMAVMARAEEIIRGIGQAVIVMHKEIDGFVMNRLQAALVDEAFRLVAAGICGPEDIDVSLRDGLALRWSFMGPFETGDLNAPGGIRDYVQRYGPAFETIHTVPLPKPDWTGPVLDEIERARRLRLLEGDFAARQRWRDRRLMALLRHKQQARDEIGD